MKIIKCNDDQVKSLLESLKEDKAPKSAPKKEAAPAVEYEFGTSTYTIDGCAGLIDPSIYCTLNDINSDAAQYILEQVSNGTQVPHAGYLLNLANYEILRVCIDAFASSLYNCYMYHTYSLNQTLLGEISDKLLIPPCGDNQFENPNTIATVLAIEITPANGYDDLLAFMNPALALILNRFGREIYTYYRACISQFLSATSIDAEGINKIMSAVNHEFCSMMMDFQYERAAFTSNISNNCSRLTPSKIIDKFGDDLELE